MVYDCKCDPCSNPAAAGNDRTGYQGWVIYLLCQILEASGGGSAPPGHSFSVTGTNVGAGAGTTEIFNSLLQQAATLIVKPHSGATTVWSVNIEISLDGTNWFPVANLTEANGVTGSTISVSGLAATDIRYNVISTDGAVDVTLQGVSV